MRLVASFALWFLLIVVAAAATLSPSNLSAQGVTTGGITGVVTDEQGRPAGGAQVRILNQNTGFTTNTVSRDNGLYYAQGLEVGGPYRVTIRRLGHTPFEKDSIWVALSVSTRVDARLATQTITLSAVQVVTATDPEFSPARQGSATTISESMVRNIPQISRDFADLTRLTPQVTRPQNGDGPSAGGQYNRFNNFTIDGANQNDRFNLGASGGVPGTAGGGRLISLEAIKEVKVSLTPSDVRQGNFTGMSVNAVTKSGTNQFTAGATVAYRNEDFSAFDLRTNKQDIKQYGFQLGGPIIRDRLHFYLAPEWQERTTPAAGPFVGGVGTGAEPSISPDSIAKIQQVSRDVLDYDAGTAGAVSIENPLTNLFGRIDFKINEEHRLVARQLFNTTENLSFSRNSNTFTTNPSQQNTGFRLGSNSFVGKNTNNSSVVQLFSNFANGTSNEFIAALNKIKDERVVPALSPEIAVGVVPLGASPGSQTTPTAAVTFGTEQFSYGNELEQDILELTNNLTIPFGAHTFTVGGRFEHTKIYNFFAQATAGVWTFGSIAGLEARTPIGYRLGYANSGDRKDIGAEFRVQTFSLYAQDQWSPTPRLAFTAGIRADVPSFLDNPSLNQALVEAAPRFNTSTMPESQVLFSPRLGFNYDVNGDQSAQLRGTVGVFTGPPPFILISNSFSNTGLGLVTLTCSTANGNVPEFTLDVNDLPKACAGQSPPAAGASGTAGVNLVSKDFKYPQSFTSSLGFDRKLPGNVVLTLEGIYRRAVNGLRIRQVNLEGPAMLQDGVTIKRDTHGRVLYADTILATGAVQNNNQRVLATFKGVNFSEGAIELQNQNRDYNYTLTAQLQKRFSPALDMTVAYTYMQAKDLQSLTSDRAISNWRFGTEYSGREDDLDLTSSYFERPHRIVAFGTYTAPWKSTQLSLFYEGRSGTPITYVYNGDVNGDNATSNDPIYVPVDATDTDEIRIGTGVGAAFVQNVEDAEAFDDFISSQKCLNEQRGRIMERNSCRSPWQYRLDFALRQSLPRVRGHQLTAQLEVFNFANLLNKKSGKTYLPTLSNVFASQSVLVQTGRNPGPLTESLPTVTFAQSAKTSGPFTVTNNTFQYYTMQLTLRYNVW